MGLAPWKVLSGTEIRVVFMIAKYLKEKGYSGFTYAGLRAYWQRNKLWRIADWHTIERIIRRFAHPTYTYLYRIKKGRKYIYVPTTVFWDVYNALVEQYKTDEV